MRKQDRVCEKAQQKLFLFSLEMRAISFFIFSACAVFRAAFNIIAVF